MNDDTFDDKLPPPDPIDLRHHIHLSGVPIDWTTNLNDEQLGQAYERLLAENILSRDDTTTGHGEVGLRFRIEEFDFFDGLCQAILVSNSVVVIYRSYEQWERHDAHEAKCDQAREAKKKQTNRMRAAYRQLLHAATMKWNAEDADGAERLLLLAWALYEDREELRRETSAHLLLLDFYAADNCPAKGLEYLDTRLYVWQEYEAFARCYGWKRPEGAFQVFTHAITKFPNQSELYKSFALLAAGGPKRIDLAIQVCETAIRRGLSDSTKSGFEGRLRRLRRKYGLG